MLLPCLLACYTPLPAICLAISYALRLLLKALCLLACLLKHLLCQMSIPLLHMTGSSNQRPAPATPAEQQHTRASNTIPRTTHSLLAVCRVLRPRSNTSAAEQLHSRIPDIIHQTYKDSNLPSAVVPMMQSWRRVNPSHEIRFYDDAACSDFVQHHFPEYLHAYR